MSSRPVLDRCPGILRPFSAADGQLIRVRQPGGRFTVEKLLGLTRAAERFGAPFLQLTSRGNLQVRGLPDPIPTDFVEALTRLDLLPSSTHERARNIVAAAGIQLDDLVRELDAAIQNHSALSTLPGRWLFVLSDESGDCLDLPYDVAFQRTTDSQGLLHCGGAVLSCRPSEAPTRLVALADAFLRYRPDASVWNVRDLPADSAFFETCLNGGRDDADYGHGGQASHGAATVDSPASRPEPPSAKQMSAPPTAPVSGPIEHPETARSAAPDLTVGIPLGLLSVAQAETLARLAQGIAHEIVVTPYRTVTVRRLNQEQQASAPDLLAAAGLEVGGTLASSVTACIGAPYCRRTESPTVELSRTALSLLPSNPPRLHVVGCSRACGTPTTEHVLVTAPTNVQDILTATGPHV